LPTISVRTQVYTFSNIFSRFSLIRSVHNIVRKVTEVKSFASFLSPELSRILKIRFKLPVNSSYSQLWCMFQRSNGLALSTVAMFVRRDRVAVAAPTSTSHIVRRVSIATRRSCIAAISQVPSRIVRRVSIDTTRRSCIAAISYVHSLTFHPTTDLLFIMFAALRFR